MGGNRAASCTEAQFGSGIYLQKLVYQWTKFWVGRGNGLLLTTLVTTSLVAFGLCVVGREAGVGGFPFVLVTTLVAFSGAFFVGDKLRRALPESGFHVSDRANRVAKVLGADAFNRFLDLIRWNRVVSSMRPRLRERRPPTELFTSVQSSGVGHAWGAAVHVVAALVAAASSWVAALWIIGLGLLLHVYPLLLQVRTHWRLERVRALGT